MPGATKARSREDPRRGDWPRSWRLWRAARCSAWRPGSSGPRWRRGRCCQEIGPGEAELVNAESHAFIVADAWFCLIVAVGGAITGVVGYRLLVRRAGWTAAAGLVLGAVAAGLLTLWIGENIGLGTYNHLLATSRNGAFFHASLGLGAKSALAFWPGLTSVIILLAEYGGRRAAESARATPGPMWTWAEGALSVD